MVSNAELRSLPISIVQTRASMQTRPYSAFRASCRKKPGRVAVFQSLDLHFMGGARADGDLALASLDGSGLARAIDNYLAGTWGVRAGGGGVSALRLVTLSQQ